MFITTPDAEHVLMSALFGQDGTKRWTYLELALATPWFCVQFWQVDDRLRLGRTFHLSNHLQLNSLLEVQDIEITNVDVALPTISPARRAGRCSLCAPSGAARPRRTRCR
jgi:hypothetical protein